MGEVPLQGSCRVNLAHIGQPKGKCAYVNAMCRVIPARPPVIQFATHHGHNAFPSVRGLLLQGLPRLGFQVKVVKTFSVAPPSLGRGSQYTPCAENFLCPNQNLGGQSRLSSFSDYLGRARARSRSKVAEFVPHTQPVNLSIAWQSLLVRQS